MVCVWMFPQIPTGLQGGAGFHSQLIKDVSATPTLGASCLHTIQGTERGLFLPVAFAVFCTMNCSLPSHPALESASFGLKPLQTES